MTEIFLLGIFHFLERDWDVCSQANQRELSEFTRKLAAFQPDAVAVECAVHQQAVIDAAYARVGLADFDNESLMRTTTLGEITLFGQTYPITWNNEAIQIGFRLARLMNLPRVHAIDADMELNDRLLGEQTPGGVSVALCRLQEYAQKHAGTSLSDSCRCYNSAQWSYLNHQIYLAANSVGAGGAYGGPAFVAQ